MSTIEKVIDALGYSGSKTLCYADSSDIKNNRFLKKLFEELNPKAIYLADDKPFIVFSESADGHLSRDLIKKVWNAQVPLLIVSFQNRIEIYNGCSIDKDEKLVLLETIGNASIDENTPFSFWSITNAIFWEKYEQELSAPKLDTVMLDNIKEATQQLKKTRCAPFAVKIILRLIFIRYLIDRGVDLAYRGLCGDVAESKGQLLNIMQNKTELYELFAHLKEQFNGNLFELYGKENNCEINLLDDESLTTLIDLMSGDLILSSGQKSLFPLYDFNIIPVEFISNIYERFLGDEKQKKDKAFYTPPYLVDYLLEQTVTPFLVENTSCKILDPACGSGIFLVESARKLIERNIAQNPDNFGNRELVSTITENLWGIDKNPEAIDVAIFSIYLTILDYKDPKTLKNFKLPSLKNKNFFVSDFFPDKYNDIHESLSGTHFDFIIGNPPWGKNSGLHVQYCKKRELPIQGNEISRSFVLRTKDFADSNTCCCLIVTSKLLYNTKSPSVAFRKWLLEETQLYRYIELAAVRELLFTKARGPAGVLIYRFNDMVSDNEKNLLCHLTLKPNIFFKLFNIIVIEKNDYKYIPQSLLLQNDWAWKTVVFGCPHDFHTIKRLKEKYMSVKQIIDKSQFASGRGIEVHAGDQQDANHLRGRKLIDAKKGIGSFFVDMRFSKEFCKDKIHRSKARRQGIFISPYTLIKKGFDTNTYKYRAVYSEDNFIYPDAITGICGKEKDKEILLSLTGLFNSSVYSYFNLMLGTSSGIEREQGFPTEIFKYPVIIDSEIAELTKQIQDTVRTEREDFDNSCESKNLIRKLDSVILEKFGLSNDAFVDYAINVQIPLVAENKMSWDKVTSEQLHDYIRVFTKYFSTIFSQMGKYVVANTYRNVANHYCAVEFVFQDTVPEKTINEYYKIDDAWINFMNKLSLNKVNDVFYQLKDVVNFSENSFYILKTDEYKNWHPAIAKLDLADVLNSILTGNEVSES